MSSRGNPTKEIDERDQNDCRKVLSLKIQTINTVLRSPPGAAKVNDKNYPTISFCELE
jgi:hypothetical protein